MAWEQMVRKCKGGTSFSLCPCSSWPINQELTPYRKYWGVASVPTMSPSATPFWGRDSILLLNQTWVCLPNAQQSQSTDTELWWRKVWHLWWGTQSGTKQGEWAAHPQKTQTPWWLLGNGFKGKVREFGVGRGKLLHLEWINKVLLLSTGNYIQYPVINHNGKEYKKRMSICV